MNIAILSNSYGEDRSGAIIAGEIKDKRPEVNIVAFPLISMGEEYRKRGIRIMSASRPPPSGGFFLKSLEGLFQDMVNSVRIPFSYVKRIHRIKERFDLSLVVGDVPLLILSWISMRKKAYFLAPCKSNYMSSHLRIERYFMKRFARVIFTHDKFTADELKKKGLKAVFMGNPMMDDLKLENNYRKPDNRKLIGLLPGSRKEAYENMKRIFPVIEVLRKENEDLHFAVAVAETLNIKKLEKMVNGKRMGIDLVTDAFVDIIKQSKLVISLAGTASEQAAGLGTPVVSFPGGGAQTTVRRLRGQKELLGESFKLLPYEPGLIAGEILDMIKNETLLKEMGEEGMKRMGQPGGAERIAEYIIEEENIT